MSKLRRQVSTHISNVAETKNLTDLKNKTGNLVRIHCHHCKKGQPDQYYHEGRTPQ